MNETINTPKISIKTMAFIGVMTAVTCILAPLSIPIGPVPISLTNLVLYFTLYLLGTKNTAISYIIYLLLGLVGLPVFSGFVGGPGKLFGPTGGYLIGFIPLILIAGFFMTKAQGKRIPEFLGMLLGTWVCYAIGTVWLSYSGGMSFKAALLAGVIPFIAEDIIKMIVAMILGRKVKKQIGMFLS
ncbi:biotin transporter BioY [Eubacterium oxidoreducens]|uniref:Biotin transporter n=1 Tax=Eubacterium oxidoreducens TaxID=1732 RepID=A0A1G6BQZ4_EUBOX|nr:biotin transporter BioY [Eubacterium oxidoreducens]SDB23019.1 biotin transport system substrate-specific component [Eubacterium oxidoreducens]